MAKDIILLIGGSGVVGQATLKELVQKESVIKIHVPVRSISSLLFMNPKVDYKVVSFMELDQFPDLFDGVTHVICAIGTTIKKAKSKEQFQIVDHYIPKMVARLAKENNVQSYSLVSSLGANKTSRNFYLQVKGQLESDLELIKLNRLLIYRPSLLDGNRREFRFGEVIGLGLFRLFSWLIPKKYAPTSVVALAQKIVFQMDQKTDGVHFFEPDVIH